MLIPSSVIAKVAAPPPTSTLIDGFEGNPLTSTLPWTKNMVISFGGLQVSTVTRTTSNVTQGVYTWRLQGTNGSSNAVGLEQANTINLTGFTTLSIDMFIVTTNALTKFNLQAYDSVGSNYEIIGSASGVTGAITLNLDLTVLPDLSAVNIAFFPLTGGADIPVDYYVDNLRAS